MVYTQGEYVLLSHLHIQAQRLLRMLRESCSEVRVPGYRSKSIFKQVPYTYNYLISVAHLSAFPR